MPLPKKISEQTGSFVFIAKGQEWSKHGHQCSSAENTHRKRWHVGRATHRAIVTSKWSNGSTSQSYIDRVVCKHCGHTWDQEWMPA